MSRRFSCALALLLVEAALATGCGSCGDDVLATVRATEGSVERDHSDREEVWEPAPVDTELSFGDGLRTGEEASAMLELSTGGRVQVGPSAKIRLGREGRPSLQVLAGAIELEADEELTIDTELGALIIEAGGRARLGAGELVVLVGSVELEREGERRTIEAGTRVAVELGELVLDPVTEPLPELGAAPPAELEDPGAAETVEPDEGGWRVRGAGAVRARAAADDEWAPLGEAETGAGGQTLALGEGDRAELQRGADRATLTAPGETSVGLDGGALSLRRGAMRVEAGEGRVVVEVPGGAIVVRGDTGRAVARITTDEEGTRVETETGLVQVRRTEEEEATVEPGESLAFEGTAAEEGGPSRIVSQGPAEVRVPASGSFAIHHPDPPVEIAMPVPAECPAGEEAVFELVGGRDRVVASGGALRARLPRGRHRYRVRCGGEVAARGRIRVVRDSATLALPRTPPSTQVDLDGRRYTVLYQNQLPVLEVRMRGGGTLEVTSPRGRTRRFRAAGGRVRIPSGTLREGTYRLRRAGESTATTVVVGFDNAARTVALREPADGSFSPGETVRVTGVTVPGWRVAVEGRDVSQDRSQRFSEQVTVPAGRGGIAVRLSHPRRGVRYYVRRVGDQ